MRKKTAFGVFLCCAILGAAVAASGDSILFPVIAVNQPNVTTIISVMDISVATFNSTHLHYVYRFKDSFAEGQPNLTGTCSSQSFTRATFSGDIVSFDVSGAVGEGNALFGDANTYGGTFSLVGTGPRRAYLLVANSDSSGTLQSRGLLMGEAVLMDIVGGAAWGYRAQNDELRSDYRFDHGNPGVYSINVNVKEFSFFPPGPPQSWTTRFFVTPIGANMDAANLTSYVRLLGLEGGGGLWDRNGTQYNFPIIEKAITCTGAIDLSGMVDATTWSAVQNSGGWGFFWVYQGGAPAVVYKLEYVFINPAYGGTNNNGFLLY